MIHTTPHILQSSWTNLHTILSFESFFPLVLQCALREAAEIAVAGSQSERLQCATPVWKSSCVAEGETGVAGSWAERLQRVEQL